MFSSVGWGEMLVLLVAALLIFGDRLPEALSQTLRGLRDLRQMTTALREQIRENAGPELSELDMRDLNPRRYLASVLWDDEAGSPEYSPARPDPAVPESGSQANSGSWQTGLPPYDPEAT